MKKKTCGGGSFAFTVTAATEAAFAIKKNKLLKLSEQQLITNSCTSNFALNGCDTFSGAPDSAMHALAYSKDNGLNLLQDYEYTADDEEQCKYNS
jgi:hypothetical protein